MLVVDIAILALLGTALVFSIIELGLSAYVVSLTDRSYNYGYGTYRTETPGEYAFLLFDSLWTLLVVGVLAALDFFGARRGGVSRPYPWLGWATLALNFLTWVFWLAGFAALAAFFGGNPRGVGGALLAFAVMLWYVVPCVASSGGEMSLTETVQADFHRSAGPQRPHSVHRAEERPSQLPPAVLPRRQGFATQRRTRHELRLVRYPIATTAYPDLLERLTVTWRLRGKASAVFCFQCPHDTPNAIGSFSILMEEVFEC